VCVDFSLLVISFSLGISVNYRRWKYTNRRADAQGTFCVAQHRDDKAPNAARPLICAKRVETRVRLFFGASDFLLVHH
jgi:hypothetical protein